MKTSVCVAAAAGCLGLAFSAAGQVQVLDTVDLGSLVGPGGFSWTTGVSDAGHVVGMSQSASGWFHPFVWTPDPNDPSGTTGVMVDLDPTGGFIPNRLSPSAAFGVNSLGQVVGLRSIDLFVETQDRAVLWSPDGAGGYVETSLGTLRSGGDGNSQANAINDVGEVVGTSDTDAAGTDGFIWTDGSGLSAFGVEGGATAINEQGYAAGVRVVGGDDIAFLRNPDGTLQNLGNLGDPFGFGTQVHDINAHNQVVGSSHDIDSVQRAFRWSPGVGMEALPLPAGAEGSSAQGISDNGDIVGYALYDDGTRRAIVWANDGSIVELPGANAYAVGINNNGRIVGSTFDSSSVEHATMWIIGLPSADPVDMVNDMMDVFQGYVDDGTLNRGQGNAFNSKLRNVLRKLERNKITPAINMLHAVMNQTAGFVNAGKFTAAEGTAIIDDLQAIVDALE